MGCELFEIGVLRRNGRMLLRSGWSADQIDAALAWLRRENARGAQIFVRPHGTHALSLVDDLSAETILRMTGAGFQPAAVIETSPGNFQVWLNHGRISLIALLAPMLRRSWRAASEVIPPVQIGATSADLRASRIRSRRDGCRPVFHRSFACMNARGALTPQRANFSRT